jgi:hypothetical protein
MQIGTYVDISVPAGFKIHQRTVPEQIFPGKSYPGNEGCSIDFVVS